MDDENKNREATEDEKLSFLDVLNMLKEMNEKREREDIFMQQSNLNIAKLQKSMFDSYVAVGFSEGQALDLTKNMINNLIRSVGPLGDK